MIRRKFAADIPHEDFSLLDLHLARIGQTKQQFLQELLEPVLRCLRPDDPFRPKYQPGLYKHGEAERG